MVSKASLAYERSGFVLCTPVIAQLRSVDPPLSESEITRERLALEQAVRRVEVEALGRAHDVRIPPLWERICSAVISLKVVA
jgi:hypothetical protein